MLQEPSPFPWWLWGLALVWAGILVTWQRGILPQDWQRGLSVVLAVYTALLAATAVSGHLWTASRVWFWLAGGVTVSAGLGLVRAGTQGPRRVCLWVAACGLAVLLVQMRADLPAALLLVLGGTAAWRMDAACDERPFGVSTSDAWLAVLGAMLVVVAWIGGIRHAVLVESQRPEYSRWVTALPAREQVERWLPQRSHHRPSLELLALAGAAALCTWRVRCSAVAEEPTP